MSDWDYRPEEEQKKEKEKKYVTRKEFRICFVILLAAIGFATFSINNSIRQSRNEISGDDLRLMVGHTDERMTEYYDKSKAIEHLDDLLLNKNTLNSIFN